MLRKSHPEPHPQLLTNPLLAADQIAMGMNTVSATPPSPDLSAPTFQPLISGIIKPRAAPAGAFEQLHHRILSPGWMQNSSPSATMAAWGFTRLCPLNVTGRASAHASASSFLQQHPAFWSPACAGSWRGSPRKVGCESRVALGGIALGHFWG